MNGGFEGALIPAAVLCGFAVSQQEAVLMCTFNNEQRDLSPAGGSLFLPYFETPDIVVVVIKPQSDL